MTLTLFCRTCRVLMLWEDSNRNSSCHRWDKIGWNFGGIFFLFLLLIFNWEQIHKLHFCSTRKMHQNSSNMFKNYTVNTNILHCSSWCSVEFSALVTHLLWLFVFTPSIYFQCLIHTYHLLEPVFLIHLTCMFLEKTHTVTGRTCHTKGLRRRIKPKTFYLIYHFSWIYLKPAAIHLHLLPPTPPQPSPTPFTPPHLHLTRFQPPRVPSLAGTGAAVPQRSRTIVPSVSRLRPQNVNCLSPTMKATKCGVARARGCPLQASGSQTCWACGQSRVAEPVGRSVAV